MHCMYTCSVKTDPKRLQRLLYPNCEQSLVRLLPCKMHSSACQSAGSWEDALAGRETTGGVLQTTPGGACWHWY